MGKVKYSKKTTPPPKPISSILKKSVCVILPRVDVTEFLRERRRRSLSQSAPPTNVTGSVTSAIPSSSGSIRIKRRFKVKKEPPCLFHSQVDITDNAFAEEIPGALDESVCNSVCVHDITKSMCYMCSPHPNGENKEQVWNEIDNTTPSSSSGYPGWHVPTPFVPITNNSASSVQNTTEPAIGSRSAEYVNEPVRSNEPPFAQIEANVNTAEIGVGTGNDLVAAAETRSQTTQTIRYFSCKQCLALFTDVAHLIHHKAVHQKMFECPFCTANFVSKNDLKSHMRLHMLPKYYDCVYCTQAFTKKHDIREHLALHADQKQFRCPQCPARFPQKNNLRNHEESHNVSKFIHVFKKIDDSEPTNNSPTSPKKTARRSTGSGSGWNQEEARCSAVSTSGGPTFISKSPRRVISSVKQIPVKSTIPSNTLKAALPSTRPSYLELASISDTPTSSNSFAAPTSAGLCMSGSVSTSTEAETTTNIAREKGLEEIQTGSSNPNFFQCQFCPLSVKHYRSFKAHSVCHIRKKGKFTCTDCGGNFMKKSGLFFHMRHSHTLG